MAWELRYTSAERGPTGRSGFQFVAVSPDTPADVEHLVAPYMTYRPPPDAPPADLAAFPTAFAYGREGGYSVLVRCRYTGRDYSGRYGNFLGHAVVATAAEMEGVRPIELWGSPVWDLPPGGSPSVVPGGSFAPDSLVEWLAADDARDRLAALLDAVAAALNGGHGRVVLVARDGGLIARWIAVLSYSLPAELAARMSFTTFTGDPAAAPQVVVGTVPGAWAGPAFRLDEPPVAARPGRFARVVADRWRAGDLDGIDAVGELIADDADWDGAAALLALCGLSRAAPADPPVSAAEQEAAASLVLRRGAPEWLWPALSPAVSELGFELAAALADVAPEIAERCVRLALEDPALRARLPRIRLRDGLPGGFRAALARAPGLADLAGVLCLAERVGGEVASADVTAAAAAQARRGRGDVAAALREAPRAWRSAIAGGIASGLEAAAADVRAAMLTPEACAALGDRDWTRTPRTGGLVLSSRTDRLAATRGLVELEPPDGEGLLTALWHAPPTVAECRWLVERLGPALCRHAALRRLAHAVFESAALDETPTLRLAGLIRDRLPELAGPARLVLHHDEALRTGPSEEVGRILDRMERTASAAREPVGEQHGVIHRIAFGSHRTTRKLDNGSGVAPRAGGGPPRSADETDHSVGERVWASVALGLAGRSVEWRAALLGAVSEKVRDGLIERWLAAAPGRGELTDLGEIEVRLHRAGLASARLAEWADGLGRLARRHVESALAGRELAADWRALRRRGA